MPTILGLPPVAQDQDRTEQSEESYATLGSYRLLSLLGEGGTGRVYLAKHLVSGSVVAVKVLRPELTVDRSAVRRFIAEARTVSQLGHPGLVRVVDVVEPSANGPLFFAMEYLAGIDLRRELQGGSMPLLRAVGIGLQICDVLQAVHEAGIIHRDLKPGNIFLVREGERDDVVKILDFGLAKLERPVGDGAASTTSGHIFGTPAYMSPEQAAGERIDRRSDLYSLGVILYEMFTARRPFEAGSFGGYVVQHVTTRPLRPSELSPPGVPIPEEVDRVVLRCLEKNPSRRQQSAAEVAAELRALLPRRTRQPSRSITAPPLTPVRRRLPAIVIAVSALVAAGTLTLTLTRGDRQPERAVEPRAAQQTGATAPDASSPTPHHEAPPASPAPSSRPASVQPAARSKVIRAVRRPAGKRGSSLDHLTMDPFEK